MSSHGGARNHTGSLLKSETGIECVEKAECGTSSRTAARKVSWNDSFSRDSWLFVENMLTKISKAQPRSALRQARKHAHRAKNSLVASPTPFDFLGRDPHMMHAV